MYEVVGRRSRFAKMYGLRIDLQRVEDALRDRGVTAICTDGDGLLLVAMLADTVDRPDGRDAQRIAADAAGLPPSAVRVLDVRRDPAAAVRKAGLPPGPRRRRGEPGPTRRPRTRSDDDVRRRAADRPGHHRPRPQLRRPRRELAVLRDDVGAPRARARPPARGLAATHAARVGVHAPACPAVVGCDAGDQRGAARGGHRARRRLARGAVQAVGRRARPARHRGIQLRPVLPDATSARRPGAPSAQHHRRGSRRRPCCGWRWRW